MSQRSGWYCPHCDAHHGPHIDTCPNAGTGMLGCKIEVRRTSLNERRLGKLVDAISNIDFTPISPDRSRAPRM